MIERRAKSPNKRGDFLSTAVLAYDALLANAERLADVAALIKRLADRK